MLVAAGRAVLILFNRESVGVIADAEKVKVAREGTTVESSIDN
jgi:hypothetical protein